jgi:iron uptake system component EfeO
MQGVCIGTFLIGLREGLEATLIVSIVGAFLKRNGQSTRPMFAGVALAVLISIAVGVGLDLLSVTLPQARQEMLETVIGAAAVLFVTSMIIWMNRNAARLKGALEHEAQQALNRGGALALVGMAFLAVLKEGFETSVFLLAAAETSTGNRWLAVLGGALGIAVSIALGVALYLGGLKLNLGRFFRITGVFLVLIAAGLVLNALRTAHEAGWVTIGQQQVFNLLPWMPSSSVQGALITGVFGIPADPRLIEVLGWLLYALPVLVVFLWPARLAPAPRTQSRLLAAASAALLVVAALLVTTEMRARNSDGNSAPAKIGGSSAVKGTVKVTMANDAGKDGCALDTTSVPAGPVTFTVTNTNAPGISEVELLRDQRIIGEKENLAPGLDPVSFTVTLDGGSYRVYCPGAVAEYQNLTVSGQAPSAPSGTAASVFAQGTKDYAAYIVDQIGQLGAGVQVLDAAVQAGNADAAKVAYANARLFWERSESTVEGFVLPGFAVGDNAGSLDYLIDMRASTPVDAKVGWKGFHAIERDLWQGGAITPGTKALSTELVGNVGKLKATVAALQYKPEDLANGASDLIEEVQNTKITGEEEAFSHIDLVDFSGNVEGAQQAYASLRPGLEKIDGNLVKQIDQQFQAVLNVLDGYRDPSAPGGYRLYTPALQAADATKLTAVIQPLHQSLSMVAQKVVTAR